MPRKQKRKREEESTLEAVLDDTHDDTEDVFKHDTPEIDDRGTNDEDEGAKIGTMKSSKLPSTGELRLINDTLNTYKNNTFRFQLEALLSKVSPKKSYIPYLDRTLQRVYTLLTSLPSIPPTHPLDAAGSLSTLRSTENKTQCSSVAIPYPSPTPSPSTAWKVAFEPPASLNVVGSWQNELAVRKPDGAFFGVDVVVEMPKSLFQENDYKNSRFFYKRAFYVACLASSFVEASLNLDVHYETVDGDVRRTCVLLTSRKGEYDFTKLRAAIRIIPVLPDDSPISSRRLSPSQSNIRGTTLSTQFQAEPHEHGEQGPPTPLYNNTLALSFARISRIRLIGSHRLLDSVPSFRDGLALLKIWANQRGFIAGPLASGEDASGTGMKKYCVRGFEGLGPWWACVLEVLINGEEPVDSSGNARKRKLQRVGKGLSSYQLFRAALDLFAKHNFETEQIFMKVIEHGQKYETVEWVMHHDAVFVDASGTVNMLAGVPLSSLQLLRYDAKVTLQLLDVDKDPFDLVFLTDVREPHARFDTVISVNLTSIPYPPSLDHASAQAATIRAIVTTIRKALNTRARAVVPLQPRSVPRPLDSAQPAPLSVLTLGIIFDPAYATRLVDHGPPVSTPEVEAFREFWGAKAELRRFKDGRILYSCVWDQDMTCTEDCEAIPGRIVRYILELHFKFPEGHVGVVGEDYGDLVTKPPPGRGPASYKDALSALEKLVKELKAIEDEGDVPLMLVAAKPTSSSLRYTSVSPPSSFQSSSHPNSEYLPAFDVVLQLERSSQWPDDLRAIQKVKLAFFETMARGLLRRNHTSCQAAVVLDEKASEIEDGYALEVVLNGWAFHLHIAHDRELSLLQDMASNTATLPAEHQAAEAALCTYRRRFVHAPEHHGAIVALCHKIPSFAYAVRLVKRWLGAHWLSARLCEEAVELLCASVYLSADTPATGKRGFVRVVRFLKNWSGAIHVPLYESIKEVDASVERDQMIAGKGRWRLMTVDDPTGTVWVEDVTIVVASRVRSLANATLECFEKGGALIFKSLFRHPIDDYDFIIELDPLIISRYWQRLDATPMGNQIGYANLAILNKDDPPRVEYSPAEKFFHDMQMIYEDTMELFYDVYGGTKIGGVWNPSLINHEQHAWKVFSGFSSLPLPLHGQQKDKPGVKFNREGIIAEIERMGEGLVTKIIVRR